MLIRDATADDWAQIWPFLRQIVAAGETYAYDPDMDEATARELWLVGPPGRTVVAVQEDGTVLGTANMYPNRPGPGSHVASASFMVDPRASGQGVGRALGQEALAWARAAVAKLARLRPRVVWPGHRGPLAGPDVVERLEAAAAA